MAVALGVHVGHDASCALVVDGQLVAAVQEERWTRIKHDGEEALSNRLPVRRCLEAAALRAEQVDVIVSSFQSAAPGGYGLHRPLIEPDFDLFDPWDERHLVVSHHLAHAYCGLGAAPFDDAAILVCDLGGSSTVDGDDHVLPFAEWHRQLTGFPDARPVQTECQSSYETRGSEVELLQRTFTLPHSAPGSFIQNVAGLYENVSYRIFRRHHAHGATMALAALAEGSPPAGFPIAADLVTINADHSVLFGNDWQHRVPWDAPRDALVHLARACQEATEHALLAHARQLRQLTNAPALALVGGSFLNILANSRIAAEAGFDELFVPSAPHDAGISVGCAFLGDHRANGGRARRRDGAGSDRLGTAYSTKDVDAALEVRRLFVDADVADDDETVEMLVDGAVLARFAGRAEFGPRALGGRSLLASPLLPESKVALNRIKGREAWRPVAPVVSADDLPRFFRGPPSSPYMSYAHEIDPAYREALPALSHPDGTTRAQSLRYDEDERLHGLLTRFGERTGYPIMVNTSLNGRGEPILETPLQALDFLLAHDGVSALLLEDRLVRRRPPWRPLEDWRDATLAVPADCLLHRVPATGAGRWLLTRGPKTTVLSANAIDVLSAVADDGSGRLVMELLGPSDSSLALEVHRLLATGFLEVVPARANPATDE